MTVCIQGSINQSWRKGIPLDSLELICIEIKPVTASYIIIVLCQPPNAEISTFEKFGKVLQFLENENTEIILIADTNCNLLNQVTIHVLTRYLLPPHDLSGTVIAQTGRSVNRQIIDLYDTYGLKQLIEVHTSVTVQKSILIDHIAVGEPRNIVDSR